MPSQRLTGRNSSNCQLFRILLNLQRPAHLLGFFFTFFAVFFFFATRCRGGAFATTPAGRSKRSHASE